MPYDPLTCDCCQEPDMPEHSPLPWKAPLPWHEPVPWEQYGTKIHVGDNVLGMMHNPGNAAFVIRAVNCHEELVSALVASQWREVHGVGLCCVGCDHVHPDHDDDCYLAAILAKAKGEA